MLGRSQQRQRRHSFLQRRPTPSSSSSSSASSSNANSLPSTSLALASAPDGDDDDRRHPPRNGNDEDGGHCRNHRLLRPHVSNVTPSRLFRKGSGRLSLPSSLSRRVHFLGTPSRGRRGQTRREDGDDGGSDRGGLGHRRGGKLFVPSQTAKSMRFELENLPLPATVASAAIALMGSEDVVDSFVEAGYFRRGTEEGDRGKEDSDEGYHDNGLYLALEGFHLTPLQTRHDRKVQFQRALQELIVSGNRNMLYSWEEAKAALSDVFVFPRVDLNAGESASEMLATDAAFAASENDGSATRSSMVSVSDVSGEEINGRHDPVSATDATEILDLTSPKPKLTARQFHPTPTKHLKSQRTPPHKRASASTTSVKSPTPKQQHQKQQQHSTSKLSLAAYQKILQKELGLEKFIRIFNRAISITSRPSIANRSDRTSADIAKLDRRITDLESQRRSTLRHEAAISAYQLRQKEKEAQLAASKLLRPLTSDEQYLVQKALYAIGPPDDILASLDADSVQRASMQTLQPGRWINDEIINYFLKNCLAKRDELLCATQPGRKRSHFFNSYFVQTLFDDKNSHPAKRGKYNYNNVKRWSKKVPGKDIFNLRYIVCPINLDNMHWTSAVIFMEEKKICYYDSLGGTEWTKLEGLLEYVKDEHKAKKGTELEGWEDWDLLGCPEDVPRQLNGYDCGVFTCMFADFISKDCPLAFKQQHVNQCRERIALSIMKNCAVD